MFYVLATALSEAEWVLFVLVFISWQQLRSYIPDQVPTCDVEHSLFLYSAAPRRIHTIYTMMQFPTPANYLDAN